MSWNVNIFYVLKCKYILCVLRAAHIVDQAANAVYLCTSNVPTVVNETFNERFIQLTLFGLKVLEGNN